jgi:tetratricopeptide (TPR) repeat protein
MRAGSMRTLVAALLHLAAAPLLLAAPPRIAFERTLPAAHDLGRIEEIAIVQAKGETQQVEAFLDELLRDLNRGGFLARDARFTTGPAEAHLDVKTLICTTAVRSSEGTARDVDGNRVKKRYENVEATCSARIEVFNRFMKHQSTFYASGSGVSPRVEAVTAEDRERAIEHAAHHAASEAAERITPRRVRESIVLDETAPAFEEGFAMIEASRFPQAKAIWEAALRRGGARSAALRFNLGAITEAMGDRRAAELHYNAAKQLAPGEARYALELKQFARRGK